MEKFKDFLFESNLARVWQHTMERNVGIISACRSINTKDDNISKSRKLQSDIRSAGYGFINVEGHYIEGYTTPEARDTKEKSYIVIGDKDFDHGNLKGLLIRLGRKYKQDAILYKQFDSVEAVLIGTQNKDENGNTVWPGDGHVVNAGRWIPQRIGEFYSKLRNGKTFIFKAIQEESNIMGKWYQSMKDKQ